jgi:exonuclease SbcD
MRFLHTSDWHIGRTVRGRSREPEHQAVLQEVLDYARQHEVDCVLVSGDVFDSSSPSAESERLVYDFFRELYGLRIPAVVIAGNHDHPRRFDALAPLLRSLDIHLVGEPREASDGGIVQVVSRDGKERAQIAALPWITERRAVEMATLEQGSEAAIPAYAEQVSRFMHRLTSEMDAGAIKLLLAHALVEGVEIGAGGGARPLHLAFGIYGITSRLLPSMVQYVGLGHVHRNQRVPAATAAAYSGSLLQLDFGEAEEEKFVNLIEIQPRQPATSAQLPVKGGRRLVDIGSESRGVHLDELGAYAETVGDAWLRVFVEVDAPVANLPGLVREALPNTVHVERVKRGGKGERPAVSDGPRAADDLFAAFYRSEGGRGREPSPATMALFRRLFDEESHEAPEP